MRVFASIVILASACAAFNVSQGTAKAASRRNFINGVTAVAIAGVVSTAAPPAAMAKDIAPLPPISGIYSDPNHKNGYRVVRAVSKSTAVVTLQDEPTGPIILVNGKIRTSKKTGTTVTLDFSPKGGPKDIVATLDEDKLLFSDGNAWTKFSGVDGIYSDPNHPAGYRVVRIGKGGKVLITLQDDPKGEVIELVGKKGKGNLTIDFSPKGGPKKLAAAVKDGQLVFPDGNTWSKL